MEGGEQGKERRVKSGSKREREKEGEKDSVREMGGGQ